MIISKKLSNLYIDKAKETLESESSKKIKSLEEKISQEESNLWRKPQGWVYYVGTPLLFQPFLLL